MLIGGASLSSKDIYSTLLVALSADNMLGGKITDKFGNPLYPGVVRAYKITSTGAYPLVQTVDIDDDRILSLYRTSTWKLRTSCPFRTGIPIPMVCPPMPEEELHGQPLKPMFMMLPPTQGPPSWISLFHILTHLPNWMEVVKMSGNISYADDFISKGTLARPVTGTSVILEEESQQQGYPGG